MLTPKFHEVVGALLALIAVGVVSYAAIVQNNGQAQGALVAIVVAANSFFLRAKVQVPDGQVTMTAATASAIPTAPSLAPTVPAPAIPEPASVATPTTP